MPQIPALFLPPVRRPSLGEGDGTNAENAEPQAWIEDQGTDDLSWWGSKPRDEVTVQRIAAQLLRMWVGLGESVGIGSAGTDRAEIGGRLLPEVARDFAVRLMDSQGVEDLSRWAWVPGTVVAWTPEGHGNVSLVAAQQNRLVPVWASSSDAGKIRGLAIGLAIAAIGLPSLVGSSVLPGIAPAMQQAFGNLVIQTALTGGDIEAAARSAFSSYAGGQFGDVVAGGLDSAASVAVGKAAAAAATAALQGGDIENAVARSLVFSGAQAMDELDFPPGDFTDPVDPWVFGDSGDWFTLDDLGIDPSVIADSDIWTDNPALSDDAGSGDWDPSLISPDEFGNLYLGTGEFVELDPVVFADSIYVDDDGNIRAPDNSILVPGDDALNMTADQLSAEIARMMDAQGGQVVESQPAPPSRPAATPPAASQTKWPSVTDATRLLDAIGKLSAQFKSTVQAVRTGTYRPPGQTSTAGTPRNTPVGVTVQLPDGRTVRNNGNGTQTVTNPDGTTTTIRTGFSGTSGMGGSLLPGVSNQTLLIGGAALLVGAFLLARRR